MLFLSSVRARNGKSNDYITYGVSQPAGKYMEAESDDLAYNTCVRPPMWAPDDNDATMVATMGRHAPHKQPGGVDMRSLPRNMNGYDRSEP